VLTAQSKPLKPTGRSIVSVGSSPSPQCNAAPADFRFNAVADPEDRASWGEEGLGACAPSGVRGQSPHWGFWGLPPPEAGVLVHSV